MGTLDSDPQVGSNTIKYEHKNSYVYNRFGEKIKVTIFLKQLKQQHKPHPQNQYMDSHPHKSGESSKHMQPVPIISNIAASYSNSVLLQSSLNPNQKVSQYRASHQQYKRMVSSQQVSYHTFADENNIKTTRQAYDGRQNQRISITNQFNYNIDSQSPQRVEQMQRNWEQQMSPQSLQIKNTIRHIHTNQNQQQNQDQHPEYDKFREKNEGEEENIYDSHLLRPNINKILQEQCQHSQNQEHPQLTFRLFQREPQYIKSRNKEQSKLRFKQQYINITKNYQNYNTLINKQQQKPYSHLQQPVPLLGATSNSALSQSVPNPTICIIYLHGFGSHRLQATTILQSLNPEQFSLCCFDFSGSGKSEGQITTYGIKQYLDIECIMQVLIKQGFSKFVFWGRSMGATASLLFTCSQQFMSKYGDKIIFQVLDSPFCTFQSIAKFHGRIMYHVPQFLINVSINLIRQYFQNSQQAYALKYRKKIQAYNAKKNTNAQIKESPTYSYNPFKIDLKSQVKKCRIPCLFVYCQQDNIIPYRQNTFEIIQTMNKNTAYEKLVIQQNHNCCRKTGTLNNIVSVIRKYVHCAQQRNKVRNMKVSFTDQDYKSKSLGKTYKSRHSGNIYKQGRNINTIPKTNIGITCWDGTQNHHKSINFDLYDTIGKSRLRKSKGIGEIYSVRNTKNRSSDNIINGSLVNNQFQANNSNTHIKISQEHHPRHRNTKLNGKYKFECTISYSNGHVNKKVLVSAQNKVEGNRHSMNTCLIRNQPYNKVQLTNKKNGNFIPVNKNVNHTGTCEDSEMFAKKTRNMKLSLNMPCIGNELDNAIHEDELGKIRNSYINSNVIQNSMINVNKHRHSQKLHHNCHPYNHVNINRNVDIHNSSNSNKDDSAFNNDHGLIKDNQIKINKLLGNRNAVKNRKVFLQMLENSYIATTPNNMMLSSFKLNQHNATNPQKCDQLIDKNIPSKKNVQANKSNSLEYQHGNLSKSIDIGNRNVGKHNCKIINVSAGHGYAHKPNPNKNQIGNYQCATSNSVSLYCFDRCTRP